jgi:hypothetical protein
MSDPSRILAWRSRWEQVNAETDREVCRLSPADRLRVVDRLRAFARARGIRSRSDEERQVWERFERLRLRQCPTLDTTEARRLVREFGEALEMPEIVEQFDRVVARHR